MLLFVEGGSFTDALFLMLRKNPHRVVPATRKQRERAEKRAASGILQLSAVQDSAKMGLCGFQVPVPYAKEPQNQYQRDMRMKGLLEVSSHYNKRHVSHIIEACVSCHFEPLG